MKYSEGPVKKCAAVSILAQVHFSVYFNRIEGGVPAEFGQLRLLGSTSEGGLDLTTNNMSGVLPSSLSALRQFHGNIGLGGQGSSRCTAAGTGEPCNRWQCPIPPITFANGSTTTSYATCHA